MADQKKMVDEITAMDVDFAKWYTDVVKKAELADYSGVKGCMGQDFGNFLPRDTVLLGSREMILERAVHQSLCHECHHGD